jgi:hypothetical protein
MNKSNPSPRKPVVLGPGEGRSYPMGRIAAIFKADAAETESRYSISEWWLEPPTHRTWRTLTPRRRHLLRHRRNEHSGSRIATVLEVVSDTARNQDKRSSLGLRPVLVHENTHRKVSAFLGGFSVNHCNFSVSGPFESDMPAIVPSSERLPAGFARFQSPLRSNVRAQTCT